MADTPTPDPDQETRPQRARRLEEQFHTEVGTGAYYGMAHPDLLRTASAGNVERWMEAAGAVGIDPLNEWYVPEADNSTDPPYRVGDLIIDKFAETQDADAAVRLGEAWEALLLDAGLPILSELAATTVDSILPAETWTLNKGLAEARSKMLAGAQPA